MVNREFNLSIICSNDLKKAENCYRRVLLEYNGAVKDGDQRKCDCLLSEIIGIESVLNSFGIDCSAIEENEIFARYSFKDHNVELGSSDEKLYEISITRGVIYKVNVRATSREDAVNYVKENIDDYLSDRFIEDETIEILK